MRDRLEKYITLQNKKYGLLLDIDILNRRINEYEPSVLNSGIGGAKSSGTSTPTENAALKSIIYKETIEKEIAQKKRELAEVEKELETLEQFIKNIPDEELQEMIKAKYMRKESWASIAVKWFYSPNSASAIQKKVVEFLNQTESTDNTYIHN